MAKPTVRLGYIGAGKYSRRVLLPNFRKIPGVELVVVANSSRESSEAAAREFGFAHIASDWHEVVRSPDLDAIVIGTRTEAHHEMISAVLDAGRHVLTMNALCRTSGQAADLVARAAQRPDLVALTYPAAGPAYFLREDAMMRHLLASYVGTVLQVTDYWYAPFFGLGSMFEVGSRWFGRHTRVLGYRRGFDAKGVTVPGRPGRGEVRPETNIALAELAGGGLITYQHSTIAGETARPRWEIVGTDAVVVAYAGSADSAGTFFGARRGARELEPLPVPPQHDHDVEVEADFIAAVRGERAPSPAIPRFEDGLRLLQFGEKWRESSETGCWCALP